MTRAAHDTIRVGVTVPASTPLDDPAVGVAVRDAVRVKCEVDWWRPVSNARLIRLTRDLTREGGRLVERADRLLVFEVEVEPND